MDMKVQIKKRLAISFLILNITTVGLNITGTANDPISPLIAVSNYFNAKSLRTKGLIITSLLVILAPWINHKLYIQHIDLRSKMKKPANGLSEKISLKNLMEHMKYIYYKFSSYLAYQDENGDWQGPIPTFDHKIENIKETLKALKKHADVIIFFGAIAYIIRNSEISESLLKLVLDVMK